MSIASYANVLRLVTPRTARGEECVTWHNVTWRAKERLRKRPLVSMSLRCETYLNFMFLFSIQAYVSYDFTVIWGPQSKPNVRGHDRLHVCWWIQILLWYEYQSLGSLAPDKARWWRPENVPSSGDPDDWGFIDEKRFNLQKAQVNKQFSDGVKNNSSKLCVKLISMASGFKRPFLK